MMNTTTDDDETRLKMSIIDFAEYPHETCRRHGRGSVDLRTAIVRDTKEAKIV